MSRCIPHPVHLTREIRRILSKKINFLVRIGIKIKMIWETRCCTPSLFSFVYGPVSTFLCIILHQCYASVSNLKENIAIKNQCDLLNLFLFQIPSSTLLSSNYELLNTPTSNQTRNPQQTSPFVCTPNLHSVFYTTASTPDHPTEQCELQTAPLTNVNSMPLHLTVLIELQSTPLNCLNSRPPH